VPVPMVRVPGPISDLAPGDEGGTRVMRTLQRRWWLPPRLRVDRDVSGQEGGLVGDAGAKNGST
jgi:hypothetical protein